MPRDPTSPDLQKPLRSLAEARAEHEEDAIGRLIAGAQSLILSAETMAGQVPCPEARREIQEFAALLSDALGDTLGSFIKRRSDERDDAQPYQRPAQWVR